MRAVAGRRNSRWVHSSHVHGAGRGVGARRARGALSRGGTRTKDAEAAFLWYRVSTLLIIHTLRK